MPISKPIDTEAASTNRHPLNNFWGDLKDVNDQLRPQRANPNKSNTFIIFDLANLEIIEANEPYNFEVTQIELMEISIPGSEWEAWKASVRSAGFNGQVNDLIGKRLHFVWSSEVLNKPVQGQQGVYSMQSSWCWKITEIEGVNNTSDELFEKVIDLANGRNDNDFKSTFMLNNDIRSLTGYSDMMVAVASNTALATLTATGKLSKDAEGIYHKV